MLLLKNVKLSNSNFANSPKVGAYGADVQREPVITMKACEIERIRSEAREEAVDTAMILLLGIPIKVLREQYGWGMKKRLPEFAEAVLDVYSDFSEGVFSTTTTVPVNLPYPPTSAYSPQDINEHIQVVCLLPEHLRHIPSRE